MKIQVLSDLHREFHPRQKTKINDEADIVVFCGDIDNDPNRANKYLESVLNKRSVEVIYVLGNHEFYGQVFNDVDIYREEINNPKIHLLDKETFKIGDVTFIGATLWSKLDRLDEVGLIQRSMNDYRVIRKSKNSYTSITPLDTNDAHYEAVEFIERSLRSTEGKVVVVTHHAPSLKSINKQYENSMLNPAFATNLEYLIEKYQPNYWLHGHMHFYVSYSINNTKIICNPLGYPKEENKTYKQNLIIEI